MNNTSNLSFNVLENQNQLLKMVSVAKISLEKINNSPSADPESKNVAAEALQDMEKYFSRLI